jgi:glycosyltransferase involved in cell wall biosynthesis
LEQRFNMSEMRGAIFIMPRSSRAWAGAEALWITVTGWSAAAKRKFGKAWVVTSDRIAQPEEVLHYPLVQPGLPSSKKMAESLRWLPLFLKTVIKDILLWRNSKNWKVIDQKPWAHEKIAFVWQQHDLFSGPGRKLATKLNVPLVTYVHAPVVWEAARWGVKRYLWGWFLERFVEAIALKQSDVVACASEDVAKKLVQMGISRKRILISPMGVDAHLFDQTQAPQLRQELSLENKMVIGWTGSFRSFHGLDILVKAFQKVHEKEPATRLLLVGDGFERKMLEDLVGELKLADAVIFAGRQPFSRIPSYVSAFDIAVVSTRSAEEFHYSPLKLREYLAAGKPVLAPNAGEIPHLFQDDLHLKLYQAGDVVELANKLLDLIQDAATRSFLAVQGKKYAIETSTWDFELSKLMETYVT